MSELAALGENLRPFYTTRDLARRLSLSERMPTPQLGERPFVKLAPLDVDFEHATDAVLVGAVGALGARVAAGPGLEVAAERLDSLRTSVSLVDRLLRFVLARESAGAPAAPTRVGVSRVPGSATVTVRALDWALAMVGRHADAPAP